MDFRKLLSVFPKTAQAHVAPLIELRRAGFREDQPRWPKGSDEGGGRWSGGAGTAPPSEGPTIRGGHHYVPKELYENEPLQEETRKVFKNGLTGRLPPGAHVNDKDHRIYSQAVIEAWRKFLAKLGIGAEQVTPDQARTFLDEVIHSSDPRIRWYNMRLWYKQFRFLMRRPRGGE